LIDKLILVFAETLGVDPSTLCDESTPDNTEKWDSVKAMELVASIEEAFLIELKTKEIMSMRSIGLARNLLAKKGVL
jgi:acyl carrier protein